MLLNRNNLAVKEVALKERETTRLPLTGVYITPKGTVATDGYILLRVERPKCADPEEFPPIPNFTPTNGKFQPFLVPRDGVDAVLAAHKKLVKKSTSMPNLNYIAIGHQDEGMVPFGMTNLEVSEVIGVRKLDEEFPDTDRVLPMDTPVFSITVSAERLMKVLKAILAMKLKSPVSALTMHFFGPERAIYMVTKTEDDQKVEALLMPVREDAQDEFRVPEPWNKEEPGEQESTVQADQAVDVAAEEEPSEDYFEEEEVPRPDPGVATTPYIPQNSIPAHITNAAQEAPHEATSGDREAEPTSSISEHATCDLCGAQAALTKIMDGTEELWLCPDCVREFEALATQAG